MTQNQTHLTVDDILSIGRRALDKTHGTEAQHIYIAREVERRLLASGAASTLAQPASVPAGWKLVPVEPTLAMLDALRADTTPHLPDRYRAMLAASPQAPQTAQAAPQLTGCNCCWDGETQVQWCELHLAHKEAIHDWAGRAKAAEAKLAAPQPEAQPHMVQALKDAIEGECDGLSITDAHAKAILEYVLAAPSAQAEPQKPNYRAECWPESPHNKAEQKGGG